VYNQIYQLASNAAFEAFEDGGLILNLNNLTLTELNHTASVILKSTDGTNDVNQVASYLEAEYEISQEQARTDILELYQSLLEQGILEVIQPHQKEESHDR